MIFLEEGIFRQICQLIQNHSNLDGNSENFQNTSRNDSVTTNHTNLRSKKGIGYGHGSIKSQWDIERAVEARYAREEQLTWLLHTLTVFLWGDNPDNISQLLEACSKIESEGFIKFPQWALESHLKSQILIEELNKIKQVLLELLEHLYNDSVFDISQHIKFYEVY